MEKERGYLASRLPYNLSEEDKHENELSVDQGFRILSAYTLQTGVTIWILTEANRRVTTILLPADY